MNNHCPEGQTCCAALGFIQCEWNQIPRWIAIATLQWYCTRSPSIGARAALVFRVIKHLASIWSGFSPGSWVKPTGVHKVVLSTDNNSIWIFAKVNLDLTFWICRRTSTHKDKKKKKKSEPKGLIKQVVSWSVMVKTPALVKYYLSLGAENTRLHCKMVSSGHTDILPFSKPMGICHG